MQNGIFKTSWATVGDAVLTAIVTAVLGFLVVTVTTTGFNLFTADWKMIIEAATNLGFIAGVVVLGKDFLSTNSGSLLGIGPNTP